MNEFTKEEMAQMSKAYDKGVAEGMRVYKSQLPTKKGNIKYVPDNQDNTYIIKSARSLKEARPKPISPECVCLLDYKAITEKFTKIVEKEYGTFSLDKIYECYFDSYNKTHNFNSLCDTISRAATNKIVNEFYVLETEECNKAEEILFRAAEKMGLKPQKDFYISKFKEYLDKNPEASAIYLKLNPEHKTKYAKICYEELEWNTFKDRKGITSNKIFENMTKNPKTFTEIDVYYERQYGMSNIEDLESTETETETEEEYERD